MSATIGLLAYDRPVMAATGGTHWAAIFASVGSIATALAFAATLITIRQQRRQGQLARLDDGLARAIKLIGAWRLYATMSGRLYPVDVELPEVDGWNEVIAKFQIAGFAHSVAALAELMQVFIPFFETDASVRSHARDADFYDGEQMKPEAQEARLEAVAAMSERDIQKPKFIAACDKASKAIRDEVEHAAGLRTLRRRLPNLFNR